MNRIKQIFNIQYPIVQAGMVWCSGWRLASAVSNAGGLGLIGAGSMRPEVLAAHIGKCRSATANSFGVNIPLMYPEVDKLMEVIFDEKVRIVFTSAGNPDLWTRRLKSQGIAVVHVVSNTKFARKAEAAGVDAIVAEGFEAGGHNGREETTTFCLLPQIAGNISVPVIAAGGIGSGKAMLAAMALGAEGVQIGSAFAVSQESSAHPNFKNAVLLAQEGDTKLSLKNLAPVRLLKNEFYEQVAQAEAQGADREQLLTLLGRGRAKKGMFEGDLEHGELEIGQVSAMLQQVEPASVILHRIWKEFLIEKERISKLEL